MTDRGDAGVRPAPFSPARLSQGGDPAGRRCSSAVLARTRNPRGAASDRFPHSSARTGYAAAPNTPILSHCAGHPWSGCRARRPMRPTARLERSPAPPHGIAAARVGIALLRTYAVKIRTRRAQRMHSRAAAADVPSRAERGVSGALARHSLGAQPCLAKGRRQDALTRQKRAPRRGFAARCRRQAWMLRRQIAQTARGARCGSVFPQKGGLGSLCREGTQNFSVRCKLTLDKHVARCYTEVRTFSRCSARKGILFFHQPQPDGKNLPSRRNTRRGECAAQI